MKMIIQRVKEAEVTVEEQVVGKIGMGLLILLGIHKEDKPEQTSWMVNKALNLRIFSDEADKMNLSVKDVGGQVLVVSQFTLYGNCMNGRRPDFIEAAGGDQARNIYDKFVSEIKTDLGSVQTGIFAAKMDVRLVNHGPVTLIVEM